MTTPQLAQLYIDAHKRKYHCAPLVTDVDRFLDTRSLDFFEQLRMLTNLRVDVLPKRESA